VRVFEETATGSSSSDWTPVGEAIYGGLEGSEFGSSVAMSENGSRIVVGTRIFYDAGDVAHVFDQPTTGTDWIQIGNPITAVCSNCPAGIWVDMSASGSRIVISTAFLYDDVIYNARVFDEPITGSDDWIQVGNNIGALDPISWENPVPALGWSIAMSADGSRIVGGAVDEWIDESGYGGVARIFQLVNDSWQLVGNEVYFEASFDICCKDVDMSADGTRIAIAVVDEVAEVRVFDQPTGDSSDWIQIGNDISSQALNLAMSANGQTVATGSGVVQVFEYTTSAKECPLIHCDFATLQVARYLSNDVQKQRLLEACGIISIVAQSKPGGVFRNVNVFNSSNIRSTNVRDDPDLGSPNRQCPNKGPGIGVGGGPNAAFPNCVAQGNLLIIQESGKPESRPNDAANGGCMYINFQRSVALVDMGFLDMEEPGLNITVRLCVCVCVCVFAADCSYLFVWLAGCWRRESSHFGMTFFVSLPVYPC
jgi:hypothetical protein